MTLFFSKVTIKDVGYAKKKEIKDAYPKKVCHMLKRHVLKKKENWTHEGPSIQKKELDT